jgi:hypothetical protein
MRGHCPPVLRPAVKSAYRAVLCVRPAWVARSRGRTRPSCSSLSSGTATGGRPQPSQAAKVRWPCRGNALPTFAGLGTASDDRFVIRTILGIHGRGSRALPNLARLLCTTESAELLRKNANSRIREFWREFEGPVRFFAQHSLSRILADRRRSEFADSLGNGAPGWSRTSDPRLRRPMLCPLSYGRVPVLYAASD